MTTDYPKLLPNRCFYNAPLMVKMFPELGEVRGWLVFIHPSGREYRLPHAWNVTADGTIVDATPWQSDARFPYRYEPAPDDPEVRGWADGTWTGDDDRRGSWAGEQS